jgi:hypothetical protein
MRILDVSVPIRPGMAPLKLVGSDGAPARVLLIQNEGAADG